MVAKFCTQCRSQFGDYFDSCPNDGIALKPMPQLPSDGNIFAERYEIIAKLGEGGMSIVYKARHRFMDRTVAIKLLRASEMNGAQALERFQHEAQAVSLLTHPNIVSVYDFGIADEIEAFLVMDYLHGTNLDHVIEQEGHIKPERAVRIFRQICEGLEHAHQKGVVHRDLKPSNICLVKDEKGREVAKIVDFGVAKMINKDSVGRMHLTQTGQVLGSPLFMSPEQCMEKPLDARSDIYSLGCVMYYALTGALPISGNTEYVTMTRHINDHPKRFKTIAPALGIPDNLEAIVFRCLEKQPQDRYQSVADVLHDLPQIKPDTGSLSAKAIEHPLRTRMRFRIFRGGFIMFVALVVLVSVYDLVDRGPNNDRGTVFQKRIWSTEVTAAQACIEAKNYGLAQDLLNHAESHSREYFNNPGRLLTTLQLQRQLYRKARMLDEFDAVNNKIGFLKDKVALDEYKSVMIELNELANPTNTSPAVNKALAELSAPNFIRAARVLAGYGLNQEEGTLLTQARDTYSKVLGGEHALIADFDTHLADFYTRSQQTYKVRPLLLEAQKIYAKAKGADDKSAITAMLRLGQFDRDESRFDFAKSELETALTQTQKYYPSDHNLIVQCLNSCADYWMQVGDKEKSEKLFAQARSFAGQANFGK